MVIVAVELKLVYRKTGKLEILRDYTLPQFIQVQVWNHGAILG